MIGKLTKEGDWKTSWRLRDHSSDPLPWGFVCTGDKNTAFTMNEIRMIVCVEGKEEKERQVDGLGFEVSS